MIPEDADFAEFAGEVKAFAAAHLAPQAARIDRESRIMPELIARLAAAGLLAIGLPEQYGGPEGSARDPVASAIRQGLVHAALGAASASVQGLVNVHGMAGSAVARWGTAAQKAAYLPRLARGAILGAIAITEPNVGSDAAAVETRLTPAGSGYRLDGQKSWITCGQVADLFVVLAAAEAGPVAVLLERPTPGLAIEPIEGMLGCRGYMLAKLRFDGCRLPADAVIGRPPFGLSHVLASALDTGRYALAWGCVGLAQACLDAACAYARTRRQFGAPIGEFQLVQRMISRMMVDVEAGRLLCRQAGVLRGRRDPGAIKAAAMAKYFCSTMVNRVAHDALQIHGAEGCGPNHPLERSMRDARIMEIIEGTNETLEIAIARYGLQEHGA